MDLVYEGWIECSNKAVGCRPSSSPDTGETTLRILPVTSWVIPRISDHCFSPSQTKRLWDSKQTAFDLRHSIALYKTKKVDHSFHRQRRPAVNNVLYLLPARHLESLIMYISSTLVGDLASTHGTRNRSAKIHTHTKSLLLLLRVSAQPQMTATISLHPQHPLQSSRTGRYPF